MKVSTELSLAGRFNLSVFFFLKEGKELTLGILSGAVLKYS